jgi:hypothetical protein
MAQVRIRRIRVPILGILFALTGLLGFARLRWRRSRRRPTGSELVRMSDTEFASFIESSGIQTVTTAGLAVPEGHAD